MRIIIIILILLTYNTIFSQSVKVKQLKAALDEKTEELEVANKALEEARKEVESLNRQIAASGGKVIPASPKPSVPSKPVKTWKKEYDEEVGKNNLLRKENRRLRNDVKKLKDKKAELEQLLETEQLKVENLEYQKKLLEEKIDAMEITIDDLEQLNRDLNRENQALDKHVSNLKRDSIEKEVKISDLEADKEYLLDNRTVLQDLAKKQRNQIDEIKNKHKVDKLQLVSSYLGLNYNLTAFNNPIISNNDNGLNRGVIPNFSLSWYNSLFGGYFSIPYNYCSNNPFANCPEDDINTYYSIRDIESAKMVMDIKGIDYQDLTFAYTENHFKTYSAGIHLAPMRYIYVSIGTSILKGSSWDLYEGDLTGFENISTDDDVVPVKNEDGYYTLNYNKLSIIKPTAGLAFVVPFRGFKKNGGTNKQIRSKVLGSYNYRNGFQLEVGYDWLFDDFYAKAGLHYRIWNYDQDILDDPDYENLASNEIRRGLEIIIQANDSEKPDEREINRGMKIVIEALIGRSVYFTKQADHFKIKGEFAQADTAHMRADKLANLACCFTKKFLKEESEKESKKESEKDEELKCEYCRKEDLRFLYEYLPDSLPDEDGLRVRADKKKSKIGSSGRETAIMKNTKKFFEEAYK